MIRILVVLSVLAFVLSACGSESPAATPGSSAVGVATTASGAATKTPAASATQGGSQTTGVGKVGTRVASSGIAVTVNSAERKAEIAGGWYTASKGNTYLVLDVTVENVEKDKTPCNVLYFTLKDSVGTEYETSIASADNELKSGDLAKGAKSKGTVTFEIPTAAKGLVVSYLPVVVGGGYQAIRIALD